MSTNNLKKIVGIMRKSLIMGGGVGLVTGGLGLSAGLALEIFEGEEFLTYISEFIEEVMSSFLDGFELVEPPMLEMPEMPEMPIDFIPEIPPDIPIDFITKYFIFAPIVVQIFAPENTDRYIKKIQEPLKKRTEQVTKNNTTQEDWEKINNLRFQLANETNPNIREQRAEEVFSDVFEKPKLSKDLASALLCASISITSLACQDYISCIPNFANFDKAATPEQKEQVLPKTMSELSQKDVVKEFLRKGQNEIRIEMTKYAVKYLLEQNEEL